MASHLIGKENADPKGVSMSHITTDICIIGAGSAGLSPAAGAVQMGASVVLFEAGDMGGDCLNTAVSHPSHCLLPPKLPKLVQETHRWALQVRWL